MRTPESRPTVLESLDRRAGPVGWQGLASGYLQLPPCRSLKFPGRGAQPSAWRKPLLGNDEAGVNVQDLPEYCLVRQRCLCFELESQPSS